MAIAKDPIPEHVEQLAAEVFAALNPTLHKVGSDLWREQIQNALATAREIIKENRK